jgi:hypothetical protein
MRPWFGNRSFRYNLCCENFFGFQVLHFVAFGKATLPQEPTFAVLRGLTMLPSRTIPVLDDFHMVQIAMGMSTTELVTALRGTLRGHCNQLNN